MTPGSSEIHSTDEFTAAGSKCYGNSIGRHKGFPLPGSLKYVFWGLKTSVSNKMDRQSARIYLDSGAYGGPTLVFWFYQPVAVFTAWPSSAGERVMVTPAASRAWNLSSAVPLPPAIMAPAWPMRLPGGAVTPAI